MSNTEQIIKNFGNPGNHGNRGLGIVESEKQAVRKRIDDWILKQREKGFAHNVAVFDEKGNFRAYGDAVFVFPKSPSEIIVNINEQLSRLKLTENQTKANQRKV